MAKKNRDDFLQSTITVMRQRAGEVCSNPECLAPTAAPCGTDKVTSIGVAAHIHAAAPGGKRYLAGMTEDERRHIDNGLWLCSNCSIIIDRDVDIFPSKILFAWKSAAEKRATEVLGKRPQSADETLGKLIEALEKRQPKLSLANAISKAHRDQEEFLEGLDHRFAVTSQLMYGKPCIELKAKESVKVQFKMRGDGYADGLRDLFDHGKKFEIDLLDTTVHGSKLLSHLLAEDAAGGKLVFSPSTRTATARIELIDPKTSVVDHLTEVTGEITAGKKSMQFEGKAFEGLFTVGFNKHLVEDGLPQTISIHTDLEQWEKRPLGTLPYLSKVAKLYQRLADGWELSLIMEHKGDVVFSGTGDFRSCTDDIKVLNALMMYTTRARSISMLLQKEVTFTKDITFDGQELANIEEIRLILENQGQVPEANLPKPMVIDVIYDDRIDQFEILGGGSPGTLRFIENDHGAVVIFGQPVRLPKRILLVEGFIPQIKKKTGKRKNGDTFKLILKPIDGYAMTNLYDRAI